MEPYTEVLIKQNYVLLALEDLNVAQEEIGQKDEGELTFLLQEKLAETTVPLDDIAHRVTGKIVPPESMGFPECYSLIRNHLYKLKWKGSVERILR